MTDAYLGAWREVLMVLAAATERRDEPPPEDEADGLRRRFRNADHQLTAIEAALRVRVYGRAIRADLNNLLIDVSSTTIPRSARFASTCSWPR